MPPIGLLPGGVDFKELKLVIKDAQASAMDGAAELSPALDALTINYGNLVQNVVDFIIVAFCIFMVIKAYKSSRKKEETATPKPSKEEILLTEILDLLKNNKRIIIMEQVIEFFTGLLDTSH
jgi:large conductance mechanosensitive channel